MNPHHRQWVTLLAVGLTMLLLGAGGVAAYLQYEHSKYLSDVEFLEKQIKKLAVKEIDSGARRPPAIVRVARAQWDSIATVDTYPGRLHPIRTSTISSEISGLIREIPIEPGTRLTGGKTLIAQIDRTWLELLAEQNEADIESAKSELTFHLAELQRIEQLAPGRAVSASDLGLQRSKTEQLHNTLLKLEVIGKEIREKLSRSTILAPYDGYVVQRITDLGELVTPGTPVAEVISLGEIDARTQVGEEVVNRLKIGDAIPILIEQLGLKIEGKVHEVVPYGPTAARPFPVLVRLDDKNGVLKAGMSTIAFIATSDPVEGIVIPKDGLLDRPEGAIVWTAQPLPDQPAPELEKTGEGAAEDSRPAHRETERHWEARPVPVLIRAYDRERYAVVPVTEEGKERLRVDTRVIIEGAERLVPGQRVRIAVLDPALLRDLPPKSGQQSPMR